MIVLQRWINRKKIEGRKNIHTEFDEILENYWKEIPTETLKPLLDFLTCTSRNHSDKLF